MAGLRNMCRAFGGMVVNGKKWVWDYSAEEPVPEEDMPLGSDRWKASEKAKVKLLRKQAGADEAAS